MLVPDDDTPPLLQGGDGSERRDKLEDRGHPEIRREPGEDATTSQPPFRGRKRVGGSKGIFREDKALISYQAPDYFESSCPHTGEGQGGQSDGKSRTFSRGAAALTSTRQARFSQPAATEASLSGGG